MWAWNAYQYSSISSKKLIRDLIFLLDIALLKQESPIGFRDRLKRVEERVLQLSRRKMIGERSNQRGHRDKDNFL